jgi:hypothetical protein
LGRRGDRFGRKGRHTLSHGTEKNRELTEKGDASPSPRKSEASASRQASKPTSPNGTSFAVRPILPEDDAEERAEAAFDNDLRAQLPTGEYLKVLQWLDDDLHHAAVQAEVSKKGDGARVVLQAYAARESS